MGTGVVEHQDARERELVQTIAEKETKIHHLERLLALVLHSMGGIAHISQNHIHTLPIKGQIVREDLLSGAMVLRLKR